MTQASGAAPDTEPLHRFTSRQFESLIRGEGDADALTALVLAERSHRLLVLDLVMDSLTTMAGVGRPLPAPQRAWNLLADTQRIAPAVVQELLDLPETGLWAGQLLQRLRAPRPTELPLWADVGHLHCIAAAAAVRAGLSFSFPVPSVEGRVDLPTLGQARLPYQAPWETAVLTSHKGGVVLTSATGTLQLPGPLGRRAPGWLPLHRDEVRPPGAPAVRVTLDDLGRHRIVPPPMGAARRLPAGAAAGLTKLIQEGCDLLVEADPPSAVTVGALLRTVQPMPAHEAFRVRSASSSHAVGGLALSWPDSELACAAAIVHELQHSKLNALSHLVPLFEEGPLPGRLYYAPWRDDPRPLPGMLQGIYAFTGVTRFWRGRTRLPAERYEPLDWFEFALWRGQLASVLPRVAADPELTAAGRRLLVAVRSTVAGWAAECPVTTAAREAVGLAQRLAADHRALWRLHHVRPYPVDTDRLAAAWLRGDEPVLPRRRQQVRAERRQRHLDARAVLARIRLVDPVALVKLRDVAEEADVPGVTGAGRADLLWATGDPSAAAEHFTRTVVDGTAPPAAWAGLRLTLEETGRSPEAVRALGAVPEVVGAVARAVRRRTRTRVDPVGLAHWVGRGLGEEV
ncbi:aKG-HExxH-type peptide beta-hydroxylase [Streptomyces sp. CA-288835]|uniref:HEXXH motif domain-containing protein n=1 Tax=Streptomyces sp. CA-288835 TaxID=3240069 RepID=UPI003D947CF0